MGIGGWITTKHSLPRFAESYDMNDIRAQWPFMPKDAQKYIACFETLAQLALALAARERHASSHLSICLPSESDNTTTEGGINKLFTTSWPLSEFLSLLVRAYLERYLFCFRNVLGGCESLHTLHAHMPLMQPGSSASVLDKHRPPAPRYVCEVHAFSCTELA